MKRIILTIFAIFLTSTLIQAAELKLEWLDPDEYRDADYYYNGGDKSKKIVLKSLEKYFVKEAKRILPDDGVLEIKILELDLAGDFEPWRTPNWDDVRIIKRLYPAIIEFDFRYLDANGSVVSEGNERLKDFFVPHSMSAQMLGRFENFPYVKSIMKDWMRKLKREIKD